MLRNSVVVRTRPQAIPLAMITITKILHGFPFLSHDDYGAPLGGPSGCRSSAINTDCLQPLFFNAHKGKSELECKVCGSRGGKVNKSKPNKSPHPLPVKSPISH